MEKDPHHGHLASGPLHSEGAPAQQRAGATRLITGAENKSAIGTLVERSTGYVMLLHLPNSHGADDVQEAMVQAMSRLPQTLRRTLTWDQGQEMANQRLSRKRPSSRSTSAILTRPGSGQRMRTRMGCCASTSPRAPTYPATTATTSISLPRNSTTGHANGSAGTPRRSARPATLGPRQPAHCCVDRLNPPRAQVPLSRDAVPRPDRSGRARWAMRWKPALNAFSITFAGRFPAAESY
jgi:hypothetical protein